MITVIAKTGFTDTWDAYLNEWSGTLTPAISIRTYEDLAAMDSVGPGPVIFCDIERLTRADRALGIAVADVAERHQQVVLNHPGRALKRYDLLTLLYERGLNPFRVYRLTDTVRPDSFPVFLRYENDHTGATTGLLSNQRELERAIVRSRLRGHDLTQLLMVEFVSTQAEDGMYHKYGAFRVGDAIVARHLFTSDDWVSKFPSHHGGVDEATLELAHVVENPHRSLLAEYFSLSQLKYGRIDYAVHDERVVVWEINSNPVILSQGTISQGPRKPIHHEFCERLDAALSDLDHGADAAESVPLTGIPPEIRQAVSAHERASASRGGQWIRAHKTWFEPIVAVAAFLAIPLEKYLIRRWCIKNGIEIPELPR